MREHVRHTMRVDLATIEAKLPVAQALPADAQITP
jgi:hypothetical protein